MFEEAKMRTMSLLIAGSILASCNVAPPPPGAPGAPLRSPSGQRAFESLISGRVAGQPISCLPTYHQNDMSIIDGQTIAFRSTSRTSYMVKLTPGCELLDAGHYALLSRQFGGAQLCRGDIQQVTDLTNHITVGSCTVAAIIPYTRP
jgi:hypothetical protein